MIPIRTYTLHGKNGMRAEITNYGAKLTRLIVPNREGQPVDVILGFNTMDEWLTQEVYFNGINGRTAGRISHGSFDLDGEHFELTKNAGEHCLHGGNKGFNDQVWRVEGQSSHSIVLRYTSPDGEEGFPGQVDVEVTYHLTRNNALSIRYRARTNRPTLLNLTNHAYFNLNGEGSGTILDHQLQVFAEEYIPYDEATLPTGEVRPVQGTMMDFRQPVRIGDRINDPFFAPYLGIDNGFALPGWNQRKRPLQRVALLSAEQLEMEVWTTMSCLQVYSGNYIEHHVGKSGREYAPQSAICLEAEGFPDAIHHALFPSSVLRPGEVWEAETQYQFLV